jgi:hypothetical protein
MKLRNVLASEDGLFVVLRILPDIPHFGILLSVHQVWGWRGNEASGLQVSGTAADGFVCMLGP